MQLSPAMSYNKGSAQQQQQKITENGHLHVSGAMYFPFPECTLLIYFMSIYVGVSCFLNYKSDF